MPSTARAIARGLTKRCPRCGSKQLFTRYFTMVERCPSCGLEFERGESAGHFLGGMMIAIGFAEIAFAITFGLGLLITWPDVPWLALTAVCLAVNAIVPVALYPNSLSTWAAIDLVMFRRADSLGRPTKANKGF